MAQTAAAAKSRRLRWALLIALALHVALLWRVAPRWFRRLESGETTTAIAVPEERIVEITPPPPPPPPPRSRGMVLSMKLGEGSPERLRTPLPEGFFPKNKPLASGSLQMAGGLDFSRASGLQIVANIVPAAVRLPGSTVLSDRARTPRLRLAPAPAATPATTRLATPATLNASEPPQAVPPPAATGPGAAEVEAMVPPPDLFADPPGARGVLAEPLPEAPPPEPLPLLSDSPVPYLLPPPAHGYDVDAAITRAAEAAERGARAANAAGQTRAAPDYRTLLPQGSIVAAPPPPGLGGKPAGGSGNASAALAVPAELLETAPAQQARRTAEQTRLAAASRQQFFAQVTAQLKVTNVRVLAAAIRAGPKATVQMQFLVDREGRISEPRAIGTSDRGLIERAMAILRTADLPPLPEAMGDGPVELSFPVEVYR